MSKIKFEIDCFLTQIDILHLCKEINTYVILNKVCKIQVNDNVSENAGNVVALTVSVGV